MSGDTDKSKAEAEGKHPRYTVVINARIQEFLNAKGPAFRALWKKRLIKGISKADLTRFQQMVTEFHETEAP